MTDVKSQDVLEPVLADPAPQAGKKKKGNSADRWTNFLMAIPPLVGFMLFCTVPLIVSIIMSFYRMPSTDFADATFVGFDNFITVLSHNVETAASGYFREASTEYLGSYLNNLIFWLNVPISMSIGLAISYLINKDIKCKKLFRTIFFVPYVCSSVAVSYSFKTMYEYNYGVFNSLLKNLGLSPIEWISSDDNFQWSVMIMQSWKNIGYCVIMLQSALARVDTSLIEAARIDGAGEGKIFWRITFPAITPIVFYLLTVCTIGAWQSMQEQQLLYTEKLGVVDAHLTPTFFMYQSFQTYPTLLGYGIASASGWILAIFILILTQINMRLSKLWVHYEF